MNNTSNLHIINIILFAQSALFMALIAVTLISFSS